MVTRIVQLLVSFMPKRFFPLYHCADLYPSASTVCFLKPPLTTMVMLGESFFYLLAGRLSTSFPKIPTVAFFLNRPFLPPPAGSLP